MDTPRVLSIADTREFLLRENDFQSIIGFDLHPNAKVLSNKNTEVITSLKSSSAIILGYESDGIPTPIDNLVTEYVQIESRTSINVVAAFSIALHVCLS